MPNSNQKGKRYERKAAKLLESLGYDARRSQQYQGVAVEGAGDLHTDLDGIIRFEVKGGYNDANITSAQVKKWVSTARDETPEGITWLILWKKSRMDWVAIAPWEDEHYLVFTCIESAINYGKKLHHETNR